MPEPCAETLEAAFTVVNIAGIHLRPAQLVARLSTSFAQLEIEAEKDGIVINAKSIMGLTELIGSCGSQIIFRATGPGASEFLDAMGKMFADGFGEEIDPQFAPPNADLHGNGAGAP